MWLIASSSRLPWMFGSACFLALAGVACQGNFGGPSSPSALGSAPSGPGSAASPYGGQAVPLIEVAGSVPAGGAGILNVPRTNEPGFNNFEVTISVHGAPPDADLYFQVVAEPATATRGDGVCNPASFQNPPQHAGGDAGVIHTSPGGAGATHIKFVIPEVPGGPNESGVSSDIKYRVVNLAQTFDLRSRCVVLTGK